MHMYVTSAQQKTDMSAVALQMALDILHKKEERDLVTGLKSRMNAGKCSNEYLTHQKSSLLALINENCKLRVKHKRIFLASQLVLSNQKNCNQLKEEDSHNKIYFSSKFTFSC